jgi:hypothetical protein
VAALSRIAAITVVVTGLLFLGTAISGGLLSTGKPTPAAAFMSKGLPQADLLLFSHGVW